MFPATRDERCSRGWDTVCPSSDFFFFLIFCLFSTGTVCYSGCCCFCSPDRVEVEVEVVRCWYLNIHRIHMLQLGLMHFEQQKYLGCFKQMGRYIHGLVPNARL
ncbi:unnamed protein product [Choristocarpus tenellus]